MKKKNIYFGDFIKNKRMNHPEQYTITRIAEHIGVSRAFYCDVENKRRAPFNGKQLKMIAEFLEFSEEDTAMMFDLASHYKGNIPYDIEDTLLNEEVGELACTALRLSKRSPEAEAKWKQLIRELEAEKKENKNNNKDGGNE